MKQQQPTRGKTITISSRLYERQTYPTRREERIVPALRLAGAWLERIGFTEGTKVTVTAENGRVVLTVAE